jgi:hypothetical protein
MFQVRHKVYKENKIETEKPVIRPSKYDGTVSWEDYEIQFELISELNNWKDDQKAMFLAASLSGNAQSVLLLGKLYGLISC